MARAPYGLPRKQRLRRSADFSAVRRGRLKSRDEFFAVNASRNEGAACIGTIVSRRVSAKAVTRNRIKRQIRESFRLHQEMLRGLHIVVVAQPVAAITSNNVLARSLKMHWQALAPT